MSNIIYANTAKAISNSIAEIVMEVQTGRVLHQFNAHEKKYMASTTKILTAITIIENCKLDDTVTVTKDTIGIEGSSIYLQEGEILTVKDLLYGLMLRSGNDCAETLAKFCCGSNTKFAELMNKTAIRIGAKNSNFVNAHGLHDDNHYTTAYDLALISSYAIKNEDFKEICSTESVYIPFTTMQTKRFLINKNKMLKNYEGCTGIKTGYTKKAGRCLVTSTDKNGMELVSVVLNCGPMWERSREILNKSYTNYTNKTIALAGEILDFFELKNRSENVGICVHDDIKLPLTNEEIENIDIKFEYNQYGAPIKKDTPLGFIKIYYKNNLIFEQKIYTIIDID